VPWADFSAEVLDGTRTVSTWCREQVPLLVALGADPSRWPEADDRELPPAARV
jgi:isopentenyl-diphosphate delta-isomerase